MTKESAHDETFTCEHFLESRNMAQQFWRVSDTELGETIWINPLSIRHVTDFPEQNTLHVYWRGMSSPTELYGQARQALLGYLAAADGHERAER